MGQLVLAHLVENVALILAPVPAPEKAVFAGGFVKLHPGVVAGGQVIIPQQQGSLQQGAEFQAAVAINTGIGVRPAQYSATKRSITSRANRSVSLKT